MSKVDEDRYGLVALQARNKELEDENARLRDRLGVAEAYIPSRDFGDYEGDALRAGDPKKEDA